MYTPHTDKLTAPNGAFRTRLQTHLRAGAHRWCGWAGADPAPSGLTCVCVCVCTHQHTQLQLRAQPRQALDHALHRPHEAHPHGVHQHAPAEAPADPHVGGRLHGDGSRPAPASHLSALCPSHSALSRGGRETDRATERSGRPCSRPGENSPGQSRQNPAFARRTFWLRPLPGGSHAWLFPFFNDFIEIRFTYRIIHPIKVYNSVVLIYVQSCTVMATIDFSTFFSTPKRDPHSP